MRLSVDILLEVLGDPRDIRDGLESGTFYYEILREMNKNILSDVLYRIQNIFIEQKYKNCQFHRFCILFELEQETHALFILFNNNTRDIEQNDNSCSLAVECIWLGTSNELKNIVSTINAVYDKAKFSYQPIQDDRHKTIILMECIRQYLSEGCFKEIDIQDVNRYYRIRCAQYLWDYLQTIQNGSDSVYETITEKLKILIKLSLIVTWQKKHNLSCDFVVQYDNLAIQNQRNKEMVYSKSLQPLNSFLPMLTLESLLLCCQMKRPDDIVNWLTEQYEQHIAAIHFWEDRLEKIRMANQKNVLNNLKYYFQYSCYFIYEHSLIGLCGELSGWLGKKIASSPSYINSKSFIKDFLIATVGVTILFTTYSPYLAQLAQKTLRYHIQRKVLSKWFQVFGGFLGVFYSYLGGAYYFIRMLLVSFMTLQLYNHFSQKITIDADANRVNKYHWIPEKRIIAHTIVISFACLEMIMFSDMIYLFSALGSIVGGMFLTKVLTYTSRLFRLTKQKQSIEDKEQISVIFFLATLLGQEVGRYFAQNGYFILEKYIDCRKVATELNSLTEQSDGQIAVDARCVDVFWSPNFWFNQYRRLRLSIYHRHEKMYYDTHCDLIKERNSEISHIDCQEPSFSSTAPLY